MDGAEGSAGRVLLVPGLWSPAWMLLFWTRALQRQGRVVYRARYRSVRQDLYQNAATLAAQIARIPGSVDLVGHSLGGVLIGVYGERYGWQRVRRVVMVASPNTGVQAAEWFARFPLGARLMGRSIAALRARAAPGPWTGPELGLIAGSKGGLPGLHAGVWDGLVGAEEVWLEGSTDRLVLPVSHGGMLLSRQVTYAIGQFLTHGRFGP
ncbi:MAG TPA: alpha/beta fold hydrolase, partial [Acidiferrobacteraceae bacterium]|nr:alpha/beta fold hydrolase [Acidiferrobacteraceae bacterium]